MGCQGALKKQDIKQSISQPLKRVLLVAVCSRILIGLKMSLNWWEKSESRGVSGLEDCSSPRKSGRQNQRCPSRRILRADIIVVRIDDDIKPTLI